MALQSAVFGELVGAISDLRESAEPASSDPLSIHLEVDLFTYRALIMLAEVYGLCFRFFPIPVHHQFDEYRGLYEQTLENQDTLKLGSRIEGALEDLLVQKPPRKMRYPVIAHCPACAKLLHTEDKLQCKQCKIAFYCNIECQRKDWDNLHRQECEKFSKLAAELECDYCTKGCRQYNAGEGSLCQQDVA